MSLTARNRPIRYVVISPVRNEAKYLQETIRSMVRQSLRPIEWILVNDGSTDGTAEIIDQWASERSWILPVHCLDRRGEPKSAAATGSVVAEKRPDRAWRARQAKEIEAFYEGYKRITANDWDFLVKLDGDVGFEPDYFEKCLAEFDRDPRLGVGGGIICHRVREKFRVEVTPQFHVRGATKIYRRACWEDIGGVIRGAGWDTLDEVKANMLGWQSRSFVQLQMVHFRHTGAANGAWQNAIKNGVWNYISGYHPLFMMLKCAKRIFEKPSFVASSGLLYGYLLGWMQRVPRIEDRTLISYLQDQQLRRLSFRSSIWK